MIAAVKMKNHLLMKVDQVKNQAAMSQIHRLLDQTLKKMMMMSIGKIRTIIKNEVNLPRKIMNQHNILVFLVIYIGNN